MLVKCSDSHSHRHMHRPSANTQTDIGECWQKLNMSLRLLLSKWEMFSGCLGLCEKRARVEWLLPNPPGVCVECVCVCVFEDVSSSGSFKATYGSEIDTFGQKKKGY